MTANPDFDTEKAGRERHASTDMTGRFWDELSNEQRLEYKLEAALAALSHRPAGEVGKLVEELRKMSDTFRRVEQVQYQTSLPTSAGPSPLTLHAQLADKAADALTALSSAPVDAGVEEMAKRLEDAAKPLYSGRVMLSPPNPVCIEAAKTLRTLSRQLTTERQAWAKVRTEIEKLNTTGKHEYALVLAILAQHTPQAGKEGR